MQAAPSSDMTPGPAEWILFASGLAITLVAASLLFYWIVTERRAARARQESAGIQPPQAGSERPLATSTESGAGPAPRPAHDENAPTPPHQL